MRSFHEPLNFFMKNCFYSYKSFFFFFFSFCRIDFQKWFFFHSPKFFSSIDFPPSQICMRQRDLSLIPRLVSMSSFLSEGKKKERKIFKSQADQLLSLAQRDVLERNIRQQTTNGSIKIHNPFKCEEKQTFIWLMEEIDFLKG